MNEALHRFFLSRIGDRKRDAFDRGLVLSNYANTLLVSDGVRISYWDDEWPDEADERAFLALVRSSRTLTAVEAPRSGHFICKVSDARLVDRLVFGSEDQHQGIGQALSYPAWWDFCPKGTPGRKVLQGFAVLGDMSWMIWANVFSKPEARRHVLDFARACKADLSRNGINFRTEEKSA